jgi:hypothetical protein
MTHRFVRHSGVGGRDKRFPVVRIGASALSVAVVLAAAMPAVAATAGPPKPALRVVSVKVFDPGTVDTTFSNPIDATKLQYEQFQAPHYYWVVPHTHIAVAFKLLDGDHKVRTVLDRGLHPTKGRCLGSSITYDPRCSTDTLEWDVAGATDVYGQKVTDKDWKVWLDGSKKHPAACRPGCP